MAVRSFVIGKAAWRDRGADLGLDIEKARQSAERFLTKIGVASQVSFEPDVVGLRAEMDRTKKALSFVAVYDGRSLAVHTYVGSALAASPFDSVVRAPANPEANLERLKLLRKHSTLVTDAEIKFYEAGSTREADVAKLKAQMAVVEKQAAVIAQQIGKLQAALKPKTVEIERLKKELAKFGE